MWYAWWKFLIFFLLANGFCKIFGSACSWEAMHCDRDEVLCDEWESVLLGAKNGQNIEHCFAVRNTGRGIRKFRNYAIELDMLSLESDEGQNSGHLGVVFNYLDQSNYDFVYLEIPSLDVPPDFTNKSIGAAFIPGYRLNGEYFLDERIAINRSAPGNIFHSFRVVVDKSSIQSTKVFLDNVFVGSFIEHFVPRLKGGVFVVNEVGSVGLFENFKFKVCKNYNENGQCPDGIEL